MQRRWGGPGSAEPGVTEQHAGPRAVDVLGRVVGVARGDAGAGDTAGLIGHAHGELDATWAAEAAPDGKLDGGGLGGGVVVEHGAVVAAGCGDGQGGADGVGGRRWWGR